MRLRFDYTVIRMVAESIIYGGESLRILPIGSYRKKKVGLTTSASDALHVHHVLGAVLLCLIKHFILILLHFV